MLACLLNNFAAAFCTGVHFISVIGLSFKSSLNQDETVAGKVAVEQTGPSQLELEPTDWLLSAEAEHKAWTANQLIAYWCHLLLRGAQWSAN